MKNFLQFTITLRKSDCQSQETLQLKCQHRMFVCRQRHPKRKRSVCLVYPTSLRKSLFKFNPTNKRITDSNARYKRIRIRHLLLWIFFSHNDQHYFLQNMDLYPWITQHIFQGTVAGPYASAWIIYKIRSSHEKATKFVVFWKSHRLH